MNSNDNGLPRLSFFSASDRGRSDEPKRETIEFTGGSAGGGNEGPISSGADNSGQFRTTGAGEEGPISPGADNTGQFRTEEPSEADEESDGPADTEKTRFRRADDRLVFEVANGASLRQAAERAGLSERTARRRWADPEFRKKVLELRVEMCWQATAQLTNQMNIAAQVLNQGMQAKSEAVRISAARSVLKLASDFNSHAEENAILMNELAELNARIDTHLSKA
jgi:transposase